MKKSNVYTRTGDSGETGLVSGNRIIKSDPRIDLYGDLDELNSRIGYSASLMKSSHVQEVNFLYQIQSALFDLGSNMACEYENRSKFKLPQLNPEVIKEMENEIDRLDNFLDPLKNFILPGGSLRAASLHLCRTFARSVERKLVHYQQTTKEELPALSIIFLNRLSDYLFVLARYVNKTDNCDEVTWKPKS